MLYPELSFLSFLALALALTYSLCSAIAVLADIGGAGDSFVPS